MNSPAWPSQFLSSSLEFQKACVWINKSRNNFKSICELYKSMLDSNFSGRFCVGERCKTIFMVEIKYDGSKWGATPKKFYSEEEAKGEAEALKVRYPWISECRVISRKEKEKDLP